MALAPISNRRVPVDPLEDWGPGFGRRQPLLPKLPALGIDPSHPLRVEQEPLPPNERGAAIERVATEGVAGVGEMNADLVSDSRAGRRANQGPPRESTDRKQFGTSGRGRVTPDRRVSTDRPHPAPALRVLSEGDVDGDRVREFAVDEREILLLDAVAGELGAQVVVAAGIAGRQEKAGGPGVQALDETALARPADGGALGVVVRDPTGEARFVRPGMGDRRQPRGLAQDENPGADANQRRFCARGVSQRPRGQDSQDVPGRDAIALRASPVVPAGAGREARGGAPPDSQRAGQHFVDPGPGLIAGDGEDEFPGELVEGKRMSGGRQRSSVPISARTIEWWR